jgi:hypothetical protein
MDRQMISKEHNTIGIIRYVFSDPLLRTSLIGKYWKGANENTGKPCEETSTPKRLAQAPFKTWMIDGLEGQF